MQAQTEYLPADRLGISEEERTALVGMIGVLEQEAVRFDMSRTCIALKTIDRAAAASPLDQPSTPCGTLCCIGGGMSLLMQNGGTLPELITRTMRDRARFYVQTNDPALPEGRRTKLTPLFYGNLGCNDPRVGIEAIERFLRGSSDPWTRA